MIRPKLLVIVCASLLASCNTGEAPVPAEQPSPTDIPETATPAPVEPATAPALSVAAMPLEPGVYNQIGGDCSAIALAGVATFTGKGFGGRSSTACEYHPTAHRGKVWAGTQTCTDTYSKERRTDPLTIRIESPTHFVREDNYGRAEFSLCPNEKLADWGG